MDAFLIPTKQLAVRMNLLKISCDIHDCSDEVTSAPGGCFLTPSTPSHLETVAEFISVYLEFNVDTHVVTGMWVVE